MHCPMLVMPQSLALHPLKNMSQVDEADHSVDFDNLYSRMDDFDNFFKTGKISFNITNKITIIFADKKYDVIFCQEKRMFRLLVILFVIKLYARTDIL